MDHLVDHYTIVFSVTGPLNGSEDGGEIVLIQPLLPLSCKSSWSIANQMHLQDKSREVCIKEKSPPALLPFKGQATSFMDATWVLHADRKGPFCK